MTAIQFHFTGGDAFYAGTIATLTAVSGAMIARSRVGRIMFSVGSIIGAVWAFLSAAPTPIVLQIIIAWGLGALMALSFVRSKERARQVISVSVMLALFGVLAIELRHQFWRGIPVQTTRRVYVVGDSVAAWVADGGDRTWPRVLADEHGLDLVSFAVSGSTTATQLVNTDGHALEAGLVIFEIGGNDMFTHRSPEDFERDLDALACRFTGAGRTVILFELPHYPLAGEYAAVQRRVADRYDIRLIPRRLFAEVLAPRDATIADGFHLKAAGHRKMAERVWQLISSAYPR